MSKIITKYDTTDTPATLLLLFSDRSDPRELGWTEDCFQDIVSDTSYEDITQELPSVHCINGAWPPSSITAIPLHSGLFSVYVKSYNSIGVAINKIANLARSGYIVSGEWDYIDMGMEGYKTLLASRARLFVYDYWDLKPGDAYGELLDAKIGLNGRTTYFMRHETIETGNVYNPNTGWCTPHDRVDSGNAIEHVTGAPNTRD